MLFKTRIEEIRQKHPTLTLGGVLVGATIFVYVLALVGWSYIDPIRNSDAGSQWLAGFVTVVLAIGAGIGWIEYVRRSRYIELSEMFASVHAEITSMEVLNLIALSKRTAAEKKVLREVFLRNVYRIEVVKKYEQAKIEDSSKRQAGKDTGPFQNLFKLVEEALGRLGHFVESDEEVDAAKRLYEITFKTMHTKDPVVQKVFGELAEFLAGNPVSPKQPSAMAHKNLPYTQMVLSSGGQGIHLGSGDGQAIVKEVWIAGSNKGDLLASFHHVDASNKRRPACHLMAGRSTILRNPEPLAEAGAVEGRELGRALLSFLASVDKLPAKCTCTGCHELRTFNESRRAIQA